MADGHSAAIVVALPFVAAFLAALLVRLTGGWASLVLALAPLAAFVLLALHLPADGAAIVTRYPWIPSLGIELSFRIDGLSLAFGLLITGIGVLIVLYAGSYLAGDGRIGRFFTYLLLFMGSMLGLVLSDSLMALFVFWELTSLTSFLLIGYDHTKTESRRAAFQALVITGGGGFLLLAGLILIQVQTGTTSLEALLAMGPTGGEGMGLAITLIILGAFAKSAQFPFHVWLPNAMQAPTPVSAYLHSATMVKAGVYLLMRLDPVFGAGELWQSLLIAAGAATFALGAFRAAGESDLKLILAQTTVASLGLLVMLTGIDNPAASAAAVLYLLAHAFFKGGLFMVAGAIDHETGTRDIARLSGLKSAMPLTFAAGLVAALSMAGIPFLLGFAAKEEVYAALLAPGLAPLLVLAVLANALMASAALQVGLTPFIGQRLETPKKAHDGPVRLLLGPLVAAASGLVLGLAGGFTETELAGPFANAIGGRMPHVPLVPHVGAAFALSMLTLAFSLLLWHFRRPVRQTVMLVRATLRIDADRIFDRLVDGVLSFAEAVQRLIQPGRLETYLTVTFLVLALALGAIFLMPGLVLAAWPEWPALRLTEALFMGLVLFGLAAVLMARTRLIAIVSLGIQGFAIAVLYLLYGAPDLSFTQFMVETLSVVILALVMTRLKLDHRDHRPLLSRLGDGAIALSCGAAFVTLMIALINRPFEARLTEFYNLHSKVVAHGANVVNVIIVDFRGTDTLGEIAVVAITGIAILALIRLKPGPAGAPKAGED